MTSTLSKTTLAAATALTLAAAVAATSAQANNFDRGGFNNSTARGSGTSPDKSYSGSTYDLGLGLLGAGLDEALNTTPER